MPTTPRTLIFSGYGLNCEEEARTAFSLSGGEADIVHINNVIEDPKLLKKYQIIALPGGFSYADDTGSGRAYARRLMHHVGEELEAFVKRDTLMIGICNGFQILTHAGLLPGSLIANDSARFVCRWVDIAVTNKSPWLNGLTRLSVPIAHGEGKYFDTKTNLARLEKQNAVALTYVKGDMYEYQKLPHNPNGSALDIAGITAQNGRILGLMPHAERALFFTQQPHWTHLREKLRLEGKELPEFAPGIELFRNAVNYFK